MNALWTICYWTVVQPFSPSDLNIPSHAFIEEQNISQKKNFVTIQNNNPNELIIADHNISNLHKD